MIAFGNIGIPFYHNRKMHGRPFFENWGSGNALLFPKKSFQKLKNSLDEFLDSGYIVIMNGRTTTQSEELST